MPDERRYHGLDALRGTMMMLGIVLHGAMYYMAAPPRTMPYLQDRDASLAFDAVFNFIHAFRMPAFFVLAGFFAALLAERRGVAGMLANRAARIGGPMVAAAVVILPPTFILMLAFMIDARYGLHQLWTERGLLEEFVRELRYAGLPTDQPSIGHLWFLYYLCWFYLAVPAIRLLATLSRGAEGWFRNAAGAPWFPVLLAAGTAATLWDFHGAQVHEGFIYLKPHVPSLAYYGSFFALGYLAHTYREFLEGCRRYATACAIAAAVLFPLSLWVSREYVSVVPYDALWHVAAVTVHALCTWALIYAFIGMALRHFDRESPWIQYVSQSSYWVFLLHMPAVTLAAWALKPYALPAAVKFSIAVAFTVLVCFVTYHYLVRRTWLGVFLHGRRFDLDWPWREARMAAPAHGLHDRAGEP